MVQQQQDDTHSHSHSRRLSKDHGVIHSHQLQYQEQALVLPLPLALPLPSPPSLESQAKCGSGPDHPNQLESTAEYRTTEEQQHTVQQPNLQPGQVQEQQQQQQQQQQQPQLEPQCGSELEAGREGNGAQKSSESSELEPDHIHMAVATVIPEGIVLESVSQAESDHIGTSLKRASRQMSSTTSSDPPAAKAKEAAFTPPKKKPRTESAKKSENDTASLFQKIFADRDPGKRKIKTKSVHEIPMDLAADEDDSDFDDTKIDSNDEDEDMMMPDDAASEDEIQPDQLETFNEEQDLLTALWQWKDNDPEVCCVCLGRSTEADNVFVYCDTLDCALCVHQACYGVKTLPSESEPWLCDRCKAPPEEVVSCVCCPSKDGAFRRLVPEDPSSGWVHVVCALWLPETTLGDPENVDKISVRDIPEKNWTMTCYMCVDPQDAALGACVQCDAGRCRKSFHITCAQGFSLLETIDDTDMADPYFMYCKQHGASDGHPKLNGWAKWVKQRDAFLRKWQGEQDRKRTKRLIEVQQTGYGDEDGGEGIVEFFEHSYSRFKHAREKRIAKERSELSRQYSIGYYLGNKIDKSRSRLEAISSKAQQALVEQRRIELHTRNLLSSLLECANYLENVSAEQLEAPLSIDTTLAWYNALPDTSRWKSDIQDIIETIDIESLACDNPYTQPISHAHLDFSLDDNESGERHGRSSKDIYGKLSKKGSKASYEAGKNVKSKKVPPKPTPTNKNQAPVVFTSSRGRQIKRDVSDPDDYYSSRSNGITYDDESTRGPRTIVPCNVCHQLTLPEEKVALERDADGMISPLAIKVLNRMVTCDTCARQFHPKCLDPPMARVPPRGYSWNCEDCDMSSESHESSEEGSPTIATIRRHHHSHSSDLDEALMVLADTAMNYSTTDAEYQPPHGVKRPLVHGSQAIDGDSRYYSNAVEGGSMKGKVARVKKVRSEDINTKKVVKSKHEHSSESTYSNGSATVVQPASAAPIIRGNLRIYPPGPHIAPKINSALMKDPAAVDAIVVAEKPKFKAVSKKATLGKGMPLARLETGLTGAKAKVKAEVLTKGLGAKTKKAESTFGKTKAASATSSKKSSPKDSSAPPTPTSPKATKVLKTAKVGRPPNTSGHKEKTIVHRGALPAVPVPAPPKPKEVIRYTVGEKTIEELTAKEDVEIERRDNVKFRKLRGRTLTMPAQDGIISHTGNMTNGPIATSPGSVASVSPSVSTSASAETTTEPLKATA
ncbi:PHD finger protein 14 [Mortierella sp. GBA43]|nr:PHD finger protein 14 [Mortierella sp. GBA43]